MKRRSDILAKFGYSVSKEARILDFGCGAGGTVYSLLDQGYINTFGYDVKDYLALRDSSSRDRFYIADANGGTKLPFEDDSFDLILSDQVLEHVMDQVGMLRELYRVMRPGGFALHVFPSRYCMVESHIYVPLGNVFAHRWWYKLWALFGIRNEYQKGLSADEVADRNAFFFVEGLNYVPNSCYEVVWRKTTSALWDSVIDVGDVTEAVVDQSKDNVFFGVRAYDRDGYRSPVAFSLASQE
jgi:SAM-dependent methyltransferase